MYAALYRLIPGPVFVKWVVMIAIFAGITYCLFEFVFPWANETFVAPPDSVAV